MKRYKMFYLLDSERNVVAINDPVAWTKLWDTLDRAVGWTEVAPGIIVQTMFVGVRRGTSKAGEPLVFESVIFDDYGDKKVTLYPTWEAAERGHERLVTEQRKKQDRRRAEDKRYRYYDLTQDGNVVDFVPGKSRYGHDPSGQILRIARTEVALGVEVMTAFDGKAPLEEDGLPFSKDGKPVVFWTSVTTDYGLEMEGWYTALEEAKRGHELVVAKEVEKLKAAPVADLGDPPYFSGPRPA